MPPSPSLSLYAASVASALAVGIALAVVVVVEEEGDVADVAPLLGGKHSTSVSQEIRTVATRPSAKRKEGS